MRDENLLEKSHVVYLSEKPMMPYFFRYQRLAVVDYSFDLVASNLGHPRRSLNQVFVI